MLKELKFVQGAVAKKDLLPAMTHFCIEDGHVRGYNGKMAISSPIPFEINCNPKADQLVKAITQCEETVTLSMTEGARLRIQSGKFRAFVETVEGDVPHPLPNGEDVMFDGEMFLEACKILYDFIGNDASRPWTNGMLFMDQSVFATNNVCLIEYWLGAPFPHTINVPRDCIREVIRVNEPPTHAQYDEGSITFHYDNGRWIRSQLLEITWPDVTKILDVESAPKNIPEGFFDGVEALYRLAESKIYIVNGMLKTHLEDFTGGVYEFDNLDFEGCYNIEMLGLLKDVVTTADFSKYPEPCLFFGDRLRGAIVGIRM